MSGVLPSALGRSNPRVDEQDRYWPRRQNLRRNDVWNEVVEAVTAVAWHHDQVSVLLSGAAGNLA
jgi:hypothetical protein